MEEFAKFEAENGPSFAWGRLSSPYDGCFHLNVVAFIRNGYAYLASDLKSFKGGHRGTNYAAFVVEPPAEFKASKYLRAGCIPADDLHTVLSKVEFHPIADLQENTPYQLYAAIMDMADELGIDVGGQFKCKICGSAFSAGEQLYYLESEFKGNGGIGVEVAAPLCEECYSERRCGYCGAEVEPYQNGIDEDGRCVCCAKPIVCPVTGLELVVDYRSDEAECEAYRRGVHSDAILAEEMAKNYEDKVSGDLFE
jgi:hypothetical protein